MWKRFKKPKIGYKKKEHKGSSEIKKRKRAAYLYTSGKSKVTFVERFLKTIIYIVLRIVIKPSKWKDPTKNYEVIDRAYKRIMSADMIFIPSSIAFYLIMAFMPILSIVFFSYSLPGFGPWLNKIGAGPKEVGVILGKFIPGSSQIFQQLVDYITKLINPDEIKDISVSVKVDVTAIVIMGLSVSISFWIAGGGFSKLVFTESYLYGHKFTGGYWSNKFKGISMVFLFTLALILVLGINLSIKAALERTNLSGQSTAAILYFILIFGIFVGIIGLFLCLFKYSPRFKLKFREVLPGALIAGMPTALFISTFGPITSMWSYGSYGVAAAVMYIGMASLFVTNFLYVGLVTNIAYYKTFVREHTIKKWTISRK